MKTYFHIFGSYACCLKGRMTEGEDEGDGVAGTREYKVNSHC